MTREPPPQPLPPPPSFVPSFPVSHRTHRFFVFVCRENHATYKANSNLFEQLMNRPAVLEQLPMVPPDQLIMPYVRELESTFREQLDQEKSRADRAEAKLNQRTIDLEKERHENQRLEARSRQVVRYQTPELYRKTLGTG